MLRIVCLATVLFCSASLLAADSPPEKRKEGPPPTAPDKIAAVIAAATPLNPQQTVLLDKPNGRVYLKTIVALREGLLEMLLCKRQSKEHESVLAIESSAQVIHAAMLAAGATPGHPARFQPVYEAPEGDRIEIWLHWTDENGKPQRATAQSWIRGLTKRYYTEKLGPLPGGLKLPEDCELRYDAMQQELIWFGIMTAEQEKELAKLSTDATFRKILHKFQVDSQPKPMLADFVFAGSQFVKQTDGKEWYAAEGGNFVCVANFGDAMIDVSIRSSEVNSDASFEPNTAVVPPLRTPVIMELIPVKGSFTPKATPKP